MVARPERRTEMASEIMAKIGKKLSDDEKKKVDPKEVGKLQAKPPKAPVEGQYMAAQVCPYCGCVGYGDVSPTVYRYFTCHCCGGVFYM
jgi:hypothetical protein